MRGQAPEPPASPLQPRSDWPRRLQAARGNDEALLALLREPAPIDVKLQAVAALARETSLRAAEKELRDHDRRVHRVARQRLTQAVAERKAHADAEEVLASTRALMQQVQAQDGPLAVNRLVEVDRAWQALDSRLIGAAQRAEYETLMAAIAALARERADRPVRLKRWHDDARAALVALRQACVEVAAGTCEPARLAPLAEAVRSAIEAGPPQALGSPLHGELQQMDQVRARLEERMAVLEAFFAAASAEPPLEPIGHAPLDEALRERIARLREQRAQADAAAERHELDQAKARHRAGREERAKALAAALGRAEAAIDAGHVAQARQALQEADKLADAAPAGDLRRRLEALHARLRQLEGWQQWSGGRARDDLVQQAEALAATAANPGSAPGIKLTTRQLADLIEEMRARWKELDRLGGATHRGLWQRFESALKVAYKPVAEQVAAQRAAREQNLHEREQLLDRLEAVPLPEADAGGRAADWRREAAALEQFRLGWRRLGPLEHTVPHAAREKLVQRMQAATQRLEVPLAEARKAARAERESLVATAKALAAQPPGRDLVGQARELQARWQQHAQSKPLARADEQALWAEFKGAIDAAFAAREAAFKARDAELLAHAAERVALIERLEAVAADATPEQLKRTLAEVDAAWRRAGNAARPDAPALEARFQRARDALVRALGTSAQRGWQVSCDALLAKLALCDEAEAAAGASSAELESRWSSLPTLPEPFEQALRQRIGLGDAAARGDDQPPGLSSDELLLRIEAAWGLPSPPAFEAARRTLKLQAMKAALETRRSAGPETPPRRLLAELLRRARPEPAQRERIDSVLAALRRRGSFDAG